MRTNMAKDPELVRAARRGSGMTQRALAGLVGLRQSNIAAIEAGTRPVSADMFERLLVAAEYRPSLPLNKHAEELKTLGKELGVTDLRVFGSIARGSDSGESDIDLLVNLVPSSIPFRLGVFKGEAEKMLGFDVDVVVDDDDRPGLDAIRAGAVPL